MHNFLTKLNKCVLTILSLPHACDTWPLTPLPLPAARLATYTAACNHHTQVTPFALHAMHVGPLLTLIAGAEALAAAAALAIIWRALVVGRRGQREPHHEQPRSLATAA